MYVRNAQPNQAVRRIVFACQCLSQIIIIFLLNLELISVIKFWGRETVIRTVTEMGDVERVTFEGVRHCE